jgi:hypothetical protein
LFTAVNSCKNTKPTITIRIDYKEPFMRTRLALSDIQPCALLELLRKNSSRRRRRRSRRGGVVEEEEEEESRRKRRRRRESPNRNRPNKNLGGKKG